MELNGGIDWYILAVVGRMSMNHLLMSLMDVQINLNWLGKKMMKKMNIYTLRG